MDLHEAVKHWADEAAKHATTAHTIVDEAERDADTGQAVMDADTEKRYNTAVSLMTQARDSYQAAKVRAEAVSEAKKLQDAEALGMPGADTRQSRAEADSAMHKRLAGLVKGDSHSAIELPYPTIRRDENGLNRLDFDEMADKIQRTGTNVSSLIPTLTMEVYRYEFEAYMLSRYVTILQTNHSNKITIGRRTGLPVATWIGESGTIGKDESDFGTPLELEAYKLGMITEVSQESLDDINPTDLARLIADDGGTAMGRGLGAAIATGNGTNKPHGIMARAATGVTGAAGGGNFVPTYDQLMDLRGSVFEPYRSRPGCAWFGNDDMLTAVMKIKDADGRPLFMVDLRAEPGMRILGKPFVTDVGIAAPAADAKSLGFGDLSQYILRHFRGMRINRSMEYLWDEDGIAWRFLRRSDGDLRDLQAVRLWVSGGA